MDTMNPEIAVLKVLLGLTREKPRRASAPLGEILLRSGIERESAHRALASLARSGLVHRTPDGPRLTMAGFAIAVATAAAIPSKKPMPRRPMPARVLPMVRRHRAA